MGRHHARCCATLDGVELVAVADPGGDPHGVAGGAAGARRRRRAHRRRHRLRRGRRARPAYHEEVGARAGRGRRHDADREAARRTTSRRRSSSSRPSRRAGLVGARRPHRALQPGAAGLRARLESGELGEVYQVVTRRQGPFPHRIADVGVVKDLATHDIDLTAWVTAAPYASVSAHTAHRAAASTRTWSSVIGQLADGTVVNHLVNWLSPLQGARHASSPASAAASSPTR